MNKRLLNNLLYGALLLSVGTSVFPVRITTTISQAWITVFQRLNLIWKDSKRNSSGFRCQFNSSFLVS